jgi:biotin carboxyl carrier protein
MSTLELQLRQGADGVELVSPDAGMFTCALSRGAAVTAGQPAGVLIKLGRAHGLTVPAGITGRIAEERPERVHEPVQAGQVLYRVVPFADGGESAAIEEESTASGMVILAPQSGRFYHRPAPGEPAFTEPGTEIAPGVPIGLIEVMKTFARVPYVAQGGLPERARVVSMIAGDGAEIQRGDPLLEVEPA